MCNPLRFSYFLCICLLLTACVTATPSGIGSTATPPAPTTPPTGFATLQPTLTSTQQGTWISLFPDYGIPGANVHIDGYLPGGLPQTDLASQDYTTYASVCWNGCQSGLKEDGLEVTWSQTKTGHFSLEFTVPPIPWLAIDGFHSLDAGDYSVDLINLDPSKVGCNSPNGCLVIPNASTTFHLTQSAAYPSCKEQYCGSLVASPTEASPGERVQVKGWAPLVQFVGLPFGYDLVLETKDNTSPENVMLLATQQNEVVQQAMDGSLTASFQVPQYGNDGSLLSSGSYILALTAPLTKEKNAFPILVAPTPFEITTAPAWAQLRHAYPLWVQPASDLSASSIAQDPLNPDRLAYCAAGEIQLSQDSGQSWTAVPVNTASLHSPSDLLMIGEEQPTCVSVTLDSTHPDSLYAVFNLVNKEYGAPPIYFIGYFTSDLGKTWQFVPLPSIATDQHMVSNNFGGFWTDGEAVQVLYYGKSSDGNQPFPLLVKQTVDGGLSWSDAPLACPSTGPCVRWGSAPIMGGGMGAEMPQIVLASPDGGKTWQDTKQFIDLRMTGPHELVALSITDILLISGTNRFPLRYSVNGGITWQVLSLPALPGAKSDWYSGYPGLQILADGSLLAMLFDTGQWMRLSPTTQNWCLTGFTSANLFPVFLQPTGDRAWWFVDTTIQPQSVRLSELVCQK